MTNQAIIVGKCVFTHMGSDGRWLSTSQALYQRDGIIREFNSLAALRQSHPDAPIIGSEKHVILPGFVNGHHHVGLTPIQLGTSDLPLELWLVARLKSRIVDPYLDTLYSAFEMVASGITTVQHIRAGTFGTIQDAERAAHEIIRAYTDIGMRVSLCFSVRDQNRVVYGDDREFVRSLPHDLQQLAEWHLSRFATTVDDHLGLFAQLRENYSSNERVELQLAPANLHWCSDDTLRKFADVSERHDAPLHIHLLETAYQQRYAQTRGSRTAFEHIKKIGLAGPRLTIGHAVWASESDLESIAETGTHICHNCSSNLRLRSGIASLNKFRGKGINVGLGIDEAGLNDDRDMLQEMRLVLNLHRTPGMDPQDVPTTDQVLHMATAGGAGTTSFGARIGTLEVGKAADLVMIDFERVSFPFLDPDTPVLDAVLHRATPRDVDIVVVAGEAIYSGGRFTRVDRQSKLDELAAHMRRPTIDEEAKSREFSLAVLPYVRKFYSDYLDPKR